MTGWIQMGRSWRTATSKIGSQPARSRGRPLIGVKSCTPRSLSTPRARSSSSHCGVEVGGRQGGGAGGKATGMGGDELRHGVVGAPGKIDCIVRVVEDPGRGEGEGGHLQHLGVVVHDGEPPLHVVEGRHLLGVGREVRCYPGERLLERLGHGMGEDINFHVHHHLFLKGGATAVACVPAARPSSRVHLAGDTPQV